MRKERHHTPGTVCTTAARVIGLALLLSFTTGVASQATGSSSSNVTVPAADLANGPSAEELIIARYYDRRNPLDGFNKYRGGFDIEDKDYIASTLWTGREGYALAVVTTAVTLLLLTAMLVTLCVPSCKCCPTSPVARAIFFGILVLGCLSMLAGGIILTVSGPALQDAASDTTDDVLFQLADAERNLTRLDELVQQAKREIPAVAGDIDCCQDMVQELAQVRESADETGEDLDKWYLRTAIACIVAGSLIIALCMALLSASLLRWNTALAVMTGCSLLLVILCWVVYGTARGLTTMTDDFCFELQLYGRGQGDAVEKILGGCPAQDVMDSGLRNIVQLSNGLADTLEQAVLQPLEQLRQTTSPELLQSLLTEEQREALCVNATACSQFGFRSLCIGFETDSMGELRTVDCSRNVTTLEQLLSLVQPSELCSGPTGPLLVAALRLPSNGSCEEQLTQIQASGALVQELLSWIPWLDSVQDCDLLRRIATDLYGEHCDPIGDALDLLSAGLLCSAVGLLVALGALVAHLWPSHDPGSDDGSIDDPLAVGPGAPPYAAATTPPPGNRWKRGNEKRPAFIVSTGGVPTPSTAV